MTIAPIHEALAVKKATFSLLYSFKDLLLCPFIEFCFAVYFTQSCTHGAEQRGFCHKIWNGYHIIDDHARRRGSAGCLQRSWR